MATDTARDPNSMAIAAWFPHKVADIMRRHQDLGVERVVFNLASEPAATILIEIDAIGAQMAKKNV